MLITIGFAWSASAQESIMQNVSPLYVDKLVATAQEYYPKFKWTTAKVNAARAAVTKVKMSYFDVLNFAYIYNPSNTLRLYGENNGPVNNNLWNGYQVGVYVNVGSVLQKPSMARQAKEELNMATHDKQIVDLNLAFEVKRRYFTYLQQSNVLRIKIKTGADAEDMLENVKYKFEKGEVSFESYSQVLLSSSEYAQEQVIAEAQMLVAKADLEELLGTKLENIK